MSLCPGNTLELGGRSVRDFRPRPKSDMASLAGGYFAHSVLPPRQPPRERSRVGQIRHPRRRVALNVVAVCAEPSPHLDRATGTQPRTLQALLFMARSLAKNELSDSEAPWGLPPALLAQLEWVGGPLPVTLTQAATSPPAPKQRAPPASEQAGRSGPDPEREDDDKDPNKKSKDYYANVGDVIRTLRDDIPCIFWKPFDYHIYRDDVVFRDPNISFRGLTNYKLVIWSLTTFGRLFFAGKEVSVVNIWQPEEGIIKMRWQVQARPRLWWLAEGVFDGISEYRLDHRGLVQEHLVTNVQLRDPPITNPLLYGLNLLMSPRLAPQPSRVPCPGSWSVGMAEEGDSPSVFGSVDA
ncbi:CPL14 [Auxenochlorella protothecoides x Auxenochlorella symbiontica]